MPRFSGFPVNYVPLVHVDTNGTVIDSEKKHTISQGWLQTYTVLNQIMQGKWETTVPTSDASLSKCSWTPWTGNVYLEFANAKTNVQLKFPIPYYGIVTQYASDNSVIGIIKVSGDTLTIPSVPAGSFISGTLSP